MILLLADCKGLDEKKDFFLDVSSVPAHNDECNCAEADKGNQCAVAG